MKWCPPPAAVRIKENEAHIWLIDLSAAAHSASNLLKLLSPDEVERAKRFVTRTLFDKYVIARGVTRTILSKYLHMAPKEIEFKYSEHGKPFIESMLHFNLSHSGEYTLLALAKEQDLGVDIEYIREIEDFEQICHRFLSHSECNAIFSLAKSEQLAKFYEIWVMKEAYIKARGGRLFDVLSDYRDRDKSILKTGDAHIQSFFTANDYLSALASLSPLREIKYWLFEG